MTSKKDYVAVAKILNRAQLVAHWEGSQERILLEQVARELADHFREDNPSFDREHFLAACGFSKVVK